MNVFPKWIQNVFNPLKFHTFSRNFKMDSLGFKIEKKTIKQKISFFHSEQLGC